MSTYTARLSDETRDTGAEWHLHQDGGVDEHPRPNAG